MRKFLNLAYCRRQAAGANCSAVNGRLASTRTDIPTVPAPDDGDVTDWMRDLFGQIENDDEYMWQDIER